MSNHQKHHPTVVMTADERPSRRRRLAAVPDPEPVECPDCEGIGHHSVVTRGVVLEPTCGTCNGEGVIEP